MEYATNGDVISCHDRIQAIEERLTGAIAAADHACEITQDCVSITLRNACYFDTLAECGIAGAASKLGIEAIDAELSAIESDTCPALFEAGCSDPITEHTSPPVFCPQFRRTVECVDGRCK